MEFKRTIFLFGILALGLWTAAGCTVKAVGDPNRPITINAHITLDIKGLERTAGSIEDYVSGEGQLKDVSSQGGTK